MCLTFCSEINDSQKNPVLRSIGIEIGLVNHLVNGRSNPQNFVLLWTQKVHLKASFLQLASKLHNCEYLYRMQNLQIRRLEGFVVNISQYLGPLTFIVSYNYTILFKFIADFLKQSFFFKKILDLKLERLQCYRVNIPKKYLKSSTLLKFFDQLPNLA